mmetsp:Transcript_4302/g.10503  ORF Transcript_4302/g.10503 Transcript_4302/m.10503 type:complete len:432 (-) Transcript_4302:19-1314(-)
MVSSAPAAASAAPSTAAAASAGTISTSATSTSSASVTTTSSCSFGVFSSSDDVAQRTTVTFAVSSIIGVAREAMGVRLKLGVRMTDGVARRLSEAAKTPKLFSCTCGKLSPVNWGSLVRSDFGAVAPKLAVDCMRGVNGWLRKLNCMGGRLKYTGMPFPSPADASSCAERKAFSSTSSTAGDIASAISFLMFVSGASNGLLSKIAFFSSKLSGFSRSPASSTSASFSTTTTSASVTITSSSKVAASAAFISATWACARIAAASAVSYMGEVYGDSSFWKASSCCSTSCGVGTNTGCSTGFSYSGVKALVYACTTSSVISMGSSTTTGSVSSKIITGLSSSSCCSFSSSSGSACVSLFSSLVGSSLGSEGTAGFSRTGLASSSSIGFRSAVSCGRSCDFRQQSTIFWEELAGSSLLLRTDPRNRRRRDSSES